MPKIKIVTEVAGRICAMGGTVADGDDFVVVEAMRMEIPVPRPQAARSRRFSSSSTMS
jgi:biotin carboxyl carrier protein